LHGASSRGQGPLVVFDCGSQPPGLIASALFGHERGAFTGADEAHVGAFEEADGGTLFLDEVGELPMELQPMLLRALESRRARRVGGDEVAFDVRVVSATHRQLGSLVRQGQFRQDLYYRLAGARVRIPPLRHRRDDIAVLAHVFADRHGITLGPELMALLSAYDWPGNVRELQHTVMRAAISNDPTFVAPELEQISVEPLPDARRRAIDEFERTYLDRVMALAGGRSTQAAELAGVSRQMLGRLLSKHRAQRGTE